MTGKQRRRAEKAARHNELDKLYCFYTVNRMLRGVSARSKPVFMHSPVRKALEEKFKPS
jgi:hypothetical protein